MTSRGVLEVDCRVVANGFKWSERERQRPDESVDVGETSDAELRPRFGAVQGRWLILSQPLEFGTKTRETRREAGACRCRTRASEQRELEAFDRRLPAAGRSVQSKQRMLQHRQ